jgi:hypothetical protein
MRKAILINPDEKPRAAEVEGLDTLQELVGGYIELMRGPIPGTNTFVNEDGKRMRLPLNRQATALHAPYLMGGDVICGPVVIVGIDDEGDTIDAPAEAWEYFKIKPPA